MSLAGNKSRPAAGDCEANSKMPHRGPDQGASHSHVPGAGSQTPFNEQSELFEHGKSALRRLARVPVATIKMEPATKRRDVFIFHFDVVCGHERMNGRQRDQLTNSPDTEWIFRKTRT